MNIKLIKFLAGLCLFLLFIIISEWLYSINSRKELLTEIETVDKRPKPVTRLPTLELTRRPESSYVNLVSRPLFIQGRRPVNETAQTASTNKPVTSGSFNWSLNGIYTYKKQFHALLTRTGAKVPKDNYRKVTKGSEVEGWIIDEIRKDMIVVSQGGQQKELPLRKAKPKTTPVNNNMSQPPAGTTPVPPQPVVPGQTPPGAAPSPEQPPGTLPVPEQIPGTIPVPEQIPDAEQAPEEVIPEPIPEIIPEPEPPIEPEMIPDQSSEIYPENSENVQLQ